MMDFIMVPLVSGIFVFGIYKLFELFVCKKERLIILEKINFDAVGTDYLKSFNNPLPFSFSALRVGCLLLGLGLGIVLGMGLFALNIENVKAYAEMESHYYSVYTFATLIISGGVLLMGGAGLILAFLIEYKCKKQKD